MKIQSWKPGQHWVSISYQVPARGSIDRIFLRCLILKFYSAFVEATWNSGFEGHRIRVTFDHVNITTEVRLILAFLKPLLFLSFTVFYCYSESFTVSVKMPKFNQFLSQSQKIQSQLFKRDSATV